MNAIRWMAFAVLAASISGCSLMGPLTSILGAIGGTSSGGSYRLTVLNQCSGENSSVSVYINSSFQGIVYASRTFYVLRGSNALRAVGMGARGSVFQRSIYADSDATWTLCS